MVQLHVADGSQIVSRRVDGSKLTVFVGAHGKERYGSCLSRLETPRLLQGYLPVLETAYTDAHGNRYRQESFAARVPQTKALVSFVRLSVEPTTTVRVCGTERMTVRVIGCIVVTGRHTVYVQPVQGSTHCVGTIVHTG